LTSRQVKPASTKGFVVVTLARIVRDPRVTKGDHSKAANEACSNIRAGLAPSPDRVRA
jgi:hypothetical protein